MNTLKKRGPLLDHLDDIEARCKQGDPTLREIFDIFGTDGHHVLQTFLVAPFLQPIPIPGLSTIFGILIAVSAALAHFNKPSWIPKRWAHKKISATNVLKIAEGTERVFEKINRFLHPRWKFLFQGPFRTINVILLILNALLLALPLPIPFTNSVPAWAIAFLLIGFLEEDGLFVILSYINSAICAVYFFAITKGVGSGLEFLLK